MIHAEGTWDYFTRCHSNAVNLHGQNGVRVLEVIDGEKAGFYGTVSESWKDVNCPKCLAKIPKRIKKMLAEKGSEP